MNVADFLPLLWDLLNSPLGITLMAGLLVYGLNRLYAAKPGWAPYEGAIVSGIKFAEKEIPDDAPQIVALLRVLVPALVRAMRDTAEDAAPRHALRERLHRRIRDTWGATGMVLVAICLVGCGTRTIYVPDGTPVRIREEIRGAKVWVLDKNGRPVATRMDIPEGWYALPIDQPQ